MSEPVVFLDPDRVQVEAGGQASVRLRIRNQGTIVEGYRLEVLGDSAAWAETLPAEVSVLPGSEVSAIVIFTPPAGGTVPSGTVPFAVKVESTVDPSNRNVVESEVEVGQQFGLQAVMRPVTSHGRWRGRHLLTVSNWGNAATHLRLTAADPDDALGFLIKPDLLDVPLGGAASARIHVRTRHPQLRGMPIRLPFQVTCEPVGQPRNVGLTATLSTVERPVVDGAFEQRPILTRAAVLIATVAVAAVVAGLGWLVVNRPATGEALLPAGAPDSPKLHATGDPADATRPILLQWTAIADVSGYTIREVKETSDGIVPLQGTVNVGAGDTSVVAPTSAPGRHCYQIQAVRTGSPASTWSTPACAVGGPPTPTPSPSPTPTPTPTPTTSATAAPSNSWVTAIVVGPAGYLDARAQRLLTVLNKRQHATTFRLVRSSAFTGLDALAPGMVSDVLVGAPLPDQASADQVCTVIRPLLTARNGGGGGIDCSSVQLGQPTT